MYLELFMQRGLIFHRITLFVSERGFFCITNSNYIENVSLMFLGSIQIQKNFM